MCSVFLVPFSVDGDAFQAVHHDTIPIPHVCVCVCVRECARFLCFLVPYYTYFVIMLFSSFGYIVSILLRFLID